MTYEEFKTGLSFADVARMLWDRPHKSRHTVLGKFREIKLEAWNEFYARGIDPETLPSPRLTGSITSAQLARLLGVPHLDVLAAIAAGAFADARPSGTRWRQWSVPRRSVPWLFGQGPGVSA